MATESAPMQTVEVISDMDNSSSGNIIKEKKKKRRSRRIKQDSSPPVSDSGIGTQIEKACLSGQGDETDVSRETQDRLSWESVLANGVDLEKPESSHRVGGDLGVNEYNLPLQCNVAFNSLPIVDMKRQTANYELGNLESPQFFTADTRGRVFLNSFPRPMLCQELAFSQVNENRSVSQPRNCPPRRKYFDPYWTAEAIKEGLKKGDVFRALFRVNAHNRLEAYCKIDGVPTDVLVSGMAAQNRAVEGDIVAIMVDSPAYWTKIKGFTENCESSNSGDGSLPSEAMDATVKSMKGKKFVNEDCHSSCAKNASTHEKIGFPNRHGFCNNGIVDEEQVGSSKSSHFNGISVLESDPCGPVKVGSGATVNELTNSIDFLSALVSAFPNKRPTGRVVGVIEESHRRGTVVGFLGVKQWIHNREVNVKDGKSKDNAHTFCRGFLMLRPTDPKFSTMIVPFKFLPDFVKRRLVDGDTTLEMDLVAAEIVGWTEENNLPEARVTRCFGRGGMIEAQIAAILFQNAIDASDFSQESLSCLPQIPWAIPPEERERRKDIRDLCVFTIDPATAADLDDAVSVERLPNDILRVGVHVADVSYFVQPDTILDTDAQLRSTSVYLLQRKLPMLPPLLSDNLGSLNPGVERLAFSMFWDINPAGEVLSRWIGRTIIQSCCRLSYEHAQRIIDGSVDPESCTTTDSDWPEIHGFFGWSDVFMSIRILHDISKILKEKRFKDGALSLESPKVVFLFNEDGIPFNCVMSGRIESNFLVEELMLLANRTAAEVITRAYPSSALLRKHPEPNLRKLREFEAFCVRNDLEMDVSSSGQLHNSLELVRRKLNNDSVLFDILMSYATKSMQLAAYFCSGELKDAESEWGHYALSVPLYTHFTSPLRRYPDIVVHRTLAAVLEAEEMYMKRKRSSKLSNGGELTIFRCFTGVSYVKDAAESLEAQEALATAALKYRLPHTKTLASVAAHCNERKMASRHVKDAIDKVYLWALLKKKEMLCVQARVLGLGPRFMTIYIRKLAIERRIYYDEVESLMVEWLDATSTLILSQSTKKRFNRRGSPGKHRTLHDIAVVVSPSDSHQVLTSFAENDPCEEHPESLSKEEQLNSGCSEVPIVEPAVFPLTLHLLSNVSVVLEATGGDDGPVDVVAKLYVSSYHSFK